MAQPDFLQAVNGWLDVSRLSFRVAASACLRGFQSLGITLREFRQLKAQNAVHPFSDDIRFNSYCFFDRSSQAGVATGGYFYQDLLVARRIFDRNPGKHVDVASRVDGFVAHVASFRPIEVFDIRPIDSKVPNVVFKQCDFMKSDAALSNYCDSLSCLHALEHFGLGRYGDPVNINGHADGFNALANVVRTGGMFYLSVPIGRQRIEFNGHRVFAISTILKLAEGKFDLVDFSYVDPEGNLHESKPVSSCPVEAWPTSSYGLGIFELKKIK